MHNKFNTELEHSPETLASVKRGLEDAEAGRVHDLGSFADLEDRSLATIRKIIAVEDIVFTNADGNEETAENIVRVVIDGWQLVTQRSNGFKVGDKVVYFEIDSILPSDNPEFAFLERYKYRLRTIKLKGQISQGLVLPISIVLPQILEAIGNGDLILDIVDADEEDPSDFPEEMESIDPNTTEGMDKLKDIVSSTFLEALVGFNVTNLLGVVKYEPPISANLRGKIKGSFPHFLRKTDEERIQNLPWLLNLIKGQEFYVTEKLDGGSFTAYYKDGGFGVCSRNLDLTETEDNTFWQTARKLKLEESLASLNGNFSIQGEMIGPGIQANKYGLTEVDLYVFNLFDIDKQEFVNFDDFRTIIEGLGLKTVPVYRHDMVFEFETVQEVVAYAEGPSALNHKTTREGVVFRPVKEQFVNRLGRLSFKAISNKFLLKYED